MKNLFLILVVILKTITVSFSQKELTEFPDFNRAMNVKENSKIEKASIFYKDKSILNGYIVFESHTDDPEFMWVDSYRFGYENKGKVQFKRINFNNIDSFRIGSYLYKFMDMKLYVGPFKITKKDLIYRVIKDYNNSTYLLQFFPEVLYDEPSYVIPNFVVFNKTTNEFFQPYLYSQDFDKKFGEFLKNCGEIQNIIEQKAKTNSLSERLNQKSKNKDVIIDEYLKIYDSCKLSKQKK